MVKRGPAAFRELAGIDTTHGVNPPLLLDRSRSEGDLRKRSFRDSEFEGLSVQAISRDDGHPITEDVEELLALVLVELRQFNKNFQTLLEME